MLQNEIHLGCRQYLLFGVGYDTYFARKQESDLTVFELDCPEMIKDKNDRMKAAGIEGDLVQIACLVLPIILKKIHLLNFFQKSVN